MFLIGSRLRTCLVTVVDAKKRLHCWNNEFLITRGTVATCYGRDRQTCNPLVSNICRFPIHKNYYNQPNFYPRGASDARVIAIIVCLSVCVSVYCIKTAKRRITQTTPRDSPVNLVFRRQNSLVDDPPFPCSKCPTFSNSAISTNIRSRRLSRESWLEKFNSH